MHSGDFLRAANRVEMSIVRIRLTTTVALLLLFLAAPLAAADPPDSARLTRDGLLKQRPMWSPDGKWLVFARHRGSTITLWIRSADGQEERRLTENKDPEFDASFSPDSQRLLYAFDKASPNQGDIDIHSVGLDGKNSTACVGTRDQLSHEEWPSWSPDGKRFAFTSTRYGNQELCVALIDGQEEARLTSDPGLDVHPAWSPDGKRIAFATDRWGDLEIAVVDPDGKNLVRLTDSRGLDDYPAWTPDGRSLALVSNRDGNLEIYLIDADGKNPRNVTSHAGIDTFPSFSPDGRLTWVGQREAGFDVYQRLSIIGGHDRRE
jgi:TolB protein